MNGQRVGLHVSAAGGVEKAPERAKEVGAECFQFFSRSPRGGGAPAISENAATTFREQCEELGMETYIHTPYYVNFASKNPKIYNGSTAVVREELERGSLLGVKYVVTHVGSAKDFVSDKKVKEAPEEALNLAVEGLKAIFADHPEGFASTLLLEISAGAGAVVGNTFEELAYLLKGLGRADVHVCLDTCHMFASGYDLRDAAAVTTTLRTFDEVIGLERFKLLHVNDSKAELDGRTDRHEHIGQGKIGAEGFKSLFAHEATQDVNFILETKHDVGLSEDLAFLKKYRKQ